MTIYSFQNILNLTKEQIQTQPIQLYVMMIPTQHETPNNIIIQKFMLKEIITPYQILTHIRILKFINCTISQLPIEEYSNNGLLQKNGWAFTKYYVYPSQQHINIAINTKQINLNNNNTLETIIHTLRKHDEHVILTTDKNIIKQYITNIIKNNKNKSQYLSKTYRLQTHQLVSLIKNM